MGMNEKEEMRPGAWDACLSAWDAPEPSAAFTANVLRQIRQESAVAPAPTWSFALWGKGLAYGTAFLLIVLGSMQVGHRAVRPKEARGSVLPMIQPQTLTGAYLALHETGDAS